MAVTDGLAVLLDDGVVEAVHGRLMSGKEASVYVVSYRGEIVAAKVYKARERRTFKATASYTEGRNQTRSTRDKRAMAKRTAYGRGLVEESWREMEYRALFDAYHAGVRVPRPIMLYEDVLLMDLVVDEHGDPAPRVADYDVAPEHAERLYRDIHEQARRLLATGRVHGDLSAFNVLIAHDGPTIIDLPQVVDASSNAQAREILRRDLRNIAEHLARYDARLLRFRDAGDALWMHWQRGTLDQAVEPRAGNVRRDDRPHGGGRRERLAESGRMSRDKGPRPQHDRPQHDRSQHGRPQHDRPQNDRPQQHRANDDRPQHDRPQHDRPQHDRPQHGRPQHGRPQHDRTNDDRARRDRPPHDRPHPSGAQPREVAPPDRQTGVRPGARRDARPPIQVDVIRRRSGSS